MTNQQGTEVTLANHGHIRLRSKLTRYKIGYATDEWGMRSSSPSGIPDPAGAWVRYEDHVAALVEAQQPAPSAAVALSDDLRDRLVAISEAIADQDDRAAQAMLKEILAAPQPSPTPQADSQPALDEVADAMADSQYLAGVSAGWNAANADNPNEALRKLHESRAGYLKPLSAARAPADSVLEDAMAWPKPGPQNPTWTICPKFLEKIMRSSASEYMPGLEEIEAVLLGLRTLFSASRVDLPGWESWPPDAQAADGVLEDAAFEAVRKKLCALPRYSFVLDDDGLVRRVQDRAGNWIEFDDAHELFDPVAIDAARKQGANHD